VEEGECEGIGTRKGFHVCLNLNLTSDPVCTNVTQRLSLGASMLLNVCRWEHRCYSTFVAGSIDVTQRLSLGVRRYTTLEVEGLMLFFELTSVSLVVDVNFDVLFTKMH